MIYRQYLPVLLLLLVIHYFAGNWWLVAAWTLLGILSVTWFRQAKFPLINILVLEIITGFLFWLLFWRRDYALSYLSDNSGVSTVLLSLTAVIVNSLTAFLCAATAMVVTRRIIIIRKK
jgi:hypothetical protein